MFGDCAAIPDLTGEPGALTSPSAQHAVRQAKVLADNIVATLRGKTLHEYRHKYIGSVAVAWFAYRTYHVSRVPTTARKVQVLIDWTQVLFFRREVVSLWPIHEPFKEFADAANQPPAP